MFTHRMQVVANDASIAAHVGALESLLSQSTLRVDVVTQIERRGGWHQARPRYRCGLFHLVGAGQCRIQSDVWKDDIHLGAGDLLVLPHGDAHRLSSRHATSSLHDGTSVICGELHFPSRTLHPLANALPPWFIVRANDASSPFRQLSSLIVNVSDSNMSGRKMLLNKLADSLFSLAVCDYANRHPERRGLFAALADGRICRLLQAVHEEPGRAWTMQVMASVACMSRSAFAERFTQLMRMPPMQYVTRLRVTIAEQWLRERQMPVAVIAERLGYGSEAAFRRLFKRVSGVSPGRIRTEGYLPAEHVLPHLTACIA